MSAFPFPVAAAHRHHRIQRPTLKRSVLGRGPHQDTLLPQVAQQQQQQQQQQHTGGETDRHRFDQQLPVIQPMHHETTLTSLPHLPSSSSSFTAVRRSRLPRRVVDIPPLNGSPFVHSPKMVKSARVFRVEPSSVTVPYPRAPHPTPVPPSTRPSSRRLVPLIPQRPALYYPTTATDIQIAEALKPYEPVTRKATASAYHHHCCQLPCRPLIHSRPRASQSRPLLPRRPGRTQAPAWTPPPSIFGVRQNVLITYYTTPPEVKEEIATTPAKHPRRKKVLPGEFTHIPSACKVSQTGARSKPPAPLETSLALPSVTVINHCANTQREKQEAEGIALLKDEDADAAARCRAAEEEEEEEEEEEQGGAGKKNSIVVVASKDAGKLAAPEIVLLPPGDAPEKQQQQGVVVEPVVAAGGEAVIGVADDDSACQSLSASDVDSAMKGIRQDSSEMKTVPSVGATAAATGDESEPVCCEGRVVPTTMVEAAVELESGTTGSQEQQPATQGAEMAATAAMNTCVSIVIEAVDEESDTGEDDDAAGEDAVDREEKVAPECDDEMMPAPPLIKTPEEEGEIPSHPVEEVDLDNPEIKLQSILDYVKIRRNEFAKLLEEHAEIVHEINKFEGGVTS